VSTDYYTRARFRAAVTQAEVTVLIINIDLEKRRVALALAPDDAALGDQVASTVAVGAVLSGTVERVESFGVFVRLGPGQTGLIPIAELNAPRGTDLRKAFAPGAELKVLVLAIEENGRRIRLSQAKALEQEERAETQQYLKDAKPGGGFGMTLGENVRKRTGRL
jgi:small subunit ribosomal protein S1